MQIPDFRQYEQTDRQAGSEYQAILELPVRSETEAARLQAETAKLLAGILRNKRAADWAKSD